MQTTAKPANLAKAKGRRAVVAAMEELEFWSNKAAMLHVMWQRGMLGGAA